MNNTTDIELQSLRKVYDALIQLDISGRQRVLNWANQWHQDEIDKTRKQEK